MTVFPNSIIFVSAFKNIGRDNWHFLSRTVDEYCLLFYDLASIIQYKLVVYVEDDIYDKLKQMNLRSNIILMRSNTVHTFYNEYIESERHMIQSNEYRQKIPYSRKDLPEHLYAEYTLVNHSKINYIVDAKSHFPNYEYYSWIDFGCIRNRPEDVPNNIDISKLCRKIIFLALKQPPTETISADEMLSSDEIYIAGSQFIVHTELIHKYYTIYKELLDSWKDMCICDDDQNANLQLYFKYNDYFYLYNYPEFFSLFRIHLNSNCKIKTRNDIVSIINTNNFRGTYIEIGITRPLVTESILKNTQLSNLILTDPYKYRTIHKYIGEINTIQFVDNYDLHWGNESHKITYLDTSSYDAVKTITDESVDIVYINGNYTYEYMLQDMRAYWSKLRPGGILFGDDIRVCESSMHINASFPIEKYGPHAALLIFCNEQNISYTLGSTYFIILKP
jgi:hypothetical protein